MARSYSTQIALALLLAVCIGRALADDDVDDSDVVVLNADNFDSFVNGEDLTVVEFYAPWCGHCKRLAPEWGKAATQLLKNDPPIKLAKVDATENRELAGRFDVSGYPTLKLFRNGQPSAYEGGRDEATIVSYVKKQVGPPAKPVESLDELKKWISGKKDDEKMWVAGFFPKAAVSTMHSAFLLSANKMRSDFVFLKVTDPEAHKEYDIPEQGQIIVFKTFDEKMVRYTGTTQTKEVANFIKTHSLPLVGELTDENADKYYKRGLPVAKLFANIDNLESKHTQYFVRRVKAAAEKHRQEVVVALVNARQAAEELKELGQEGKKAVFIVENPDDRSKYLMRSDFNTKNVMKHVEDVIAGTAEKFIKSEDEPADNNGPVKVVTGRNFDSIVYDPDQNVLIEFYAPWCGHCKALAPKYEELGKKMKKKYENVVIAKIDATANDFDRSKFDVSGYPTIFFVKAKKSATPEKYEGDREVSAMRSFVKQNSRNLKKKSKKGKK